MISKAQGNLLFSLPESYQILYQAVRTMPYLIRGEKKGLISPALRERLMIAVTEVNGCAMCSWYHARMAMETGLTSDETRHMLAGELQDVPEAEVTAVLFAQLYADTRGNPDLAAWGKLCAQYGKEAALAMLGAIRGIMAGNAYGIPAGSLLFRLGVKRFHTDLRSTLFYELAILLLGAVFTPLSVLHAGVAWLFRLPVEPNYA